MPEIDEGLEKPCSHCARTIYGANYFCPRCRVWYCLMCGIASCVEDVQNAETN